MTPPEVAALLAVCSRYDLRTVGEADVIAWHAILADVHSMDALAAVRVWFSEPHERRVLPGDVRALARAIRGRHLAELDQAAVPDADPDDPRAYIAALRAHRSRELAELRRRDVAHLEHVFREVARR